MAKSDDMYELSEGMQSLKKQAQDLGMFTGDRELLSCQTCGLKEGLSFEGELYTYRDPAIHDHLGLHFPEPDKDGSSCCPACGKMVKGT